MSKLLSRVSQVNESGCTQKITPESAGWKYVGFESFELKAGQTLTQDLVGQELCIVVVGGKATISTEDNLWSGLGKRKSPFDRVPPDAVYIAPNRSFTITAETDVEIALTKAPAEGLYPSRLISSDDLSYVSRGSSTNERFVCNILFGENQAESLLVVEVITPSGHWSSYPPHKHDTSDGLSETQLEETYYHRVSPSQGFVFQRVYTDDREIDDTMAVEDKDVVMVPKGYHPVAAPHGYESYYLNVMAGPERRWVFKNDPQHEWIVDL